MGEGNRDKKVVASIVKGLRSEPAYLLVFGLVLIILTEGALNIKKNTWLGALIIVVGLVLAGFAIYFVEKRKRHSLYVSSPKERENLSGLQDKRIAIRGVFEDLIDNESPSYFVYSNTPVKEFFDHNWQKIDYPFAERERRVTTIPDAQGIAEIHTLLHLGGKTERLRVITAHDFTPAHWDNNLILIGSRNSNPKSEDALRNFNSPLKFSDDMKTIVGPSSNEGPWPKPAQENLDYGIIVKLKIAMNDNKQRVYFVIAGIGPAGTLACCHYLQENIVSIHKKFKVSPFACLISVNRSLGYTSVKEQKCMEITVYHAH